jgi:hypothetical protein
MSDWKTRWQQADSELQGGLSDLDVLRMRRAVVAAASEAPNRAGGVWPRTFVVMATLLVVVCASVLTGLQRATQQMNAPALSDMAEAGAPVDLDASAGERQQLQFQTPGGTRIIWVFDAEFDEKGTWP